MGERSYTGVTRADVNKIRSGLGGFGIKMPAGDDVDVVGPLGVKMHVTYDESGQKLNLSIVKKPGWVSESQIWKVIESTAGGIGRK
jgi:hypothetical protein